MAFFKFVDMFPNIQPELKAKIFQFIIIPSFSVAFQRGEGEKLVCSSSTTKQDSIVTVFIEKIIDSESSAKSSDEMRILLLQFSSLLTEHVPSHI
ncbi:Transformation/transcription domain-associated protein, partial [Stegodyphus mimosarum]